MSLDMDLGASMLVSGVVVTSVGFVDSCTVLVSGMAMVSSQVFDLDCLHEFCGVMLVRQVEDDFVFTVKDDRRSDENVVGLDIFIFRQQQQLCRSC